MNPLHILMILGSTRDGRIGERVGTYVKNSLEALNYTVDVFDPLVLDLPILRQALRFYPDPSKAPQNLIDLNQRVINADAFVLVTPEYNRQLPPGLLNTIDHFPSSSFSGKASGIVTYSMGPYGGNIAGALARILMVELAAMPVPAMLSIGSAHQKIDTFGRTNTTQIETDFSKLVSQLDWWGKATRHHRQKAGPMPPTFG